MIKVYNLVNDIREILNTRHSKKVLQWKNCASKNYILHLNIDILNSINIIIWEKHKLTQVNHDKW